MLHVLNGLLGAIVIEGDDTVPMWLQNMTEQVFVMHYMSFEELQKVHEEMSSPIALNFHRLQSVSVFCLCKGAYLPTVDLVSQEWVRLRLVLASHEASLTLQIRSTGNGGTCEVRLLATDGIALQNPSLVSFIAFAPGSRRDIARRCEINWSESSFELRGVSGAAGEGEWGR